MRFDFAKIETCQVLKLGEKMPTIRYSMPIIHEDGTPWTIKHDRPNTVYILTGIKDVQE